MSDRRPSLHEALGTALDAAREPAAEGRARLDAAGVSTEIDCQEIGPVGVIVDRLRITGPDGDIAERAAALAEALRPQGERLDAVEVDPVLGGAVLRTRPRDMREGRFFQVEVGPEAVELSRHRRRPEGGRVAESFALTREELSRTVEAIGEVLQGGAGPGEAGQMPQHGGDDQG